MSTNWTLSSQDIVTDAMQIMGVVGAGETVSGEDYSVAMTTLQNILKEMPYHGLSFPKITAAPSAITWSSGTPKQVSMPSDYFGVPVISFVQNAVNVDLQVINKAEYDAIEQPDVVALYPQKIYIAANNIGYLWPVPSADPSLSITYQSIATDAVLSSQPDVLQAWLGGLGLWLAYELCPKFSVPMEVRADIERRFMFKRGLMLSWATETAPISFEARD